MVKDLPNFINCSRLCRQATLIAVFALIFPFLASASFAAQNANSDGPVPVSSPSAKGVENMKLDRSGKTRKGKASYYGHEFYKKKMADGTPMDPQSNEAASKTLPLGTKAKVTNLENGSSEVVEIRDRGPYVKGRIVDVSPKTADKLGLKENGTAPVEVKPVAVPQADGTVKPGTGAQGATPGVSPVDLKETRNAR